MLSHSSTAKPVEEVPETPFYIPGTGSSTRPRRTLKQGDCFAVLDSHADIGATPGGPDGIFYCDTRYLSHLEMLLNGRQSLLLGSAVRDDNSFLTVDLTNPDIFLDQKLVQPKDMLHVVRTLFVLNGSRLSAPAPAEPRRAPVRRPAFVRLRQRLRRPVRGARAAPQASRHRDHPGRQSRGCPELPGPRRQPAAHADPVRSRAGKTIRRPGRLRLRSAAQRIPVDIRNGELRTRRRGTSRRCVPQGTARGVP